MGTLQVSGSGRFRAALAGLAGSLAVALGASPAAGAPPLFGPGSPLGSTARTDAAPDAPPVVAAGRDGTWVALWESNDSLGGTIGTDSDVLFARSADGGASWSATAAIDPLAATDAFPDGEPAVASDGHGRWVAVWRSDRRTGGSGDLDLLVARSTDDGVTWSPAQLLHASLASDSRQDSQPAVAADGQGGWVVAWRSAGSDTDLFFARSADDGATWSAPARLSPDPGTEQQPAIGADGQGDWVAVWAANNGLGTLGADSDVLFARSADGGLTWSAPAALHANASADAGQDAMPSVASDGAGGWIVAWQSNDTFANTLGTDLDVVAVRSGDGGATWSEPAPVHAYAAADQSGDGAPSVACGAPRHCAVAWHSNERLGTLGLDFDVLFAMTEDGGASWQPPAAVDPRATLDAGADREPALAADRRGTWVSVWQSNDSFGGTIGTDTDPVVAVGIEASVCGDGALQAQEACDDGNLASGDGCRADCTAEVCGDGLLDAGEACDDGNVSSSDGCRFDCTVEMCGDGLLDAGEACDDGNVSSSDGCRFDCTVEVCGDGLLDAGEACDDGNLAGGDGCRADCTAEICGDGLLDAGEACDDGNATSGDGCDAVCRVETAPPSPPPPGPPGLVGFFDAAVADGTLVGVGRPRAARARLLVLRTWLVVATRWMDEGDRGRSCSLLPLPLARVDGHPRPRDFARGPAAPELARRIRDVVETGCGGVHRPHRHGRRR